LSNSLFAELVTRVTFFNYVRTCIVFLQEGESSELWVEKYKPTNSKAIIRQQGDSSNMKKLTVWLTNWEKNHSGTGKKAGSKPPPWNSGADNGFWAKAALLSGPPGNFLYLF
jgi:hypothetical protein